MCQLHQPMAQLPMKDGELEGLCLQSLLAVLAVHFSSHFFYPPIFYPFLSPLCKYTETQLVLPSAQLIVLHKIEDLIW